MINTAKYNRSSKGFTLIEILIAMAILGVIIIAVLTALDPVEQLRKSQDTARLQAADQFLNAVNRYVASKSCYPWNVQTGNVCDISAPEVPPDTGTAIDPNLMTSSGVYAASLAANGALTYTMQALIGDSGELKPDFVKNESLRRIYVAYAPGTETLYVCFPPASKTFRNSKYVSTQRDGTTACTAGNWGTATTSCHYCIK